MKRSVLSAGILVICLLAACGGGDGGDGAGAVAPSDGVYSGRDDFRMVVTAGEVVSVSGSCDDPTGADASWDVWYGQAGRTSPLVVKPPSEPARFSMDGEPWFGDRYHFSTPRGEGAGELRERADRGEPPLVWALHPDASEGSPRTKNLTQPEWRGRFAEDGASVFVDFQDFDWDLWVGIDASLDGPIYPYWACNWSGRLETGS